MKWPDQYMQAQYMQARGSVRSEGGKQEKQPTEQRRCHKCKEVGHIAKDCPKSRNPRGSEGRDSKDKRPLTCFNCHQMGQKATECPGNVLCCREQSREESKEGRSSYRKGKVNHKSVHDIILDTGCSRTMVKWELISEDDLTGEATTIRCAHGDTVLYPLATVRTSVGDYSVEVEAAASTTLPVSVLMGTDIQRLNKLSRGEDTSMAVITRSQRQCQAEQEEKEVQEEEMQGVEATPVITGSEEAQEAIQQEQQDAGVFPLTNFHEDLFGPQKSRKKASRKQKRLLKQQFRQDINSEPRFPMGELREQQNMDPSLEEVRRLAQAKQFGFFFSQWTCVSTVESPRQMWKQI